MDCCKPGEVISPIREVQTIDVGTATDPNDKQRSNMEDEYSTLLNHQDDLSFFAVFDGHGGHQVSRYCKQNLHRILFQRLQGSFPEEEELKSAWIETYATIDEDIRTHLADDPDAECAGSTSTTVLITPEHEGWLLSVANAGDSKAMLYSREPYPQADCITVTHRPSLPEEAERVKAAGGFVAGEKSKRLNGRLAVTRALGDHFIKKTTKGLVSTPSISTHHVKAPSILVIASDGLWDFAEEDAKRYLLTEDVFNKTAQQLAQTFSDMAIKHNSNDNIAVVVIYFTKRIIDDSAPKSPLPNPHQMREIAG